MTSGEFRAQLAGRALLTKIDISDALAARLEAYYRLLAQWNGRINLTALALNPTSDHAVDRLFIEPIAAAQYIPPEAAVWFDVGSGGGSPAIPLRLMRQGGQLIMVESRERKAAFLREVVRVLSLTNTGVQAQRIEEAAESVEFNGTVDVITVRAVRMEPRVISAFKALLRPTGLILLFGSKPEELLRSAGFEIVAPALDNEQLNLFVLKRAQ